MQPIKVSTTDATSGTTYSRSVRMDSFAAAQSIIQVDVTGTVTYTVETSMDDPNDPFSPVAQANMTWFNCADGAVVNKNASAQGILTATPTFVRIKQTAGNGSTTMTIAQFSNAPY
jgi:hypothetical protein